MIPGLGLFLPLEETTPIIQNLVRAPKRPKLRNNLPNALSTHVNFKNKIPAGWLPTLV